MSAFLATCLAVGSTALGFCPDRDLLYQHVVVNTSVAFGTLDVVGSPADLAAYAAATCMSADLAAAVETAMDPHLSGLTASHGTMTDLDFLTTSLVDLGDPVQAVIDEFQTHVAQLQPPPGTSYQLFLSTDYLGVQSFGLDGGLMPNFPDSRHDTYFTGTAKVEFNQVNATAVAQSNPSQHPPTPEPATWLVWSGVLLCLGGYAWRRRAVPRA